MLDKDTSEEEVKETEVTEELETEEESGEKETKASAVEDDKDDDSEDDFDESEDDDLAQYSKSVQRRIGRLTAKSRELERRELEALEYAKAVKSELDTLKKREQQLSKNLETEAEVRLKAQEQLLKDQFKLAVDSGDVDKQVEAQQTLAQLAIERERLRNYKVYREQQETAVPQNPVTPPAPPPRPDKKAQDWANRNQWFGSDRAMTFTAYEIHNDLMNEGYDGAADDYYKELDMRMRKEFPNKFKEIVQKKPASAVASGRPTQVKKASTDAELTESQKSIARRLGVSYDDYKRQLKLARERAE
jgi:hypothetical protein